MLNFAKALSSIDVAGRLDAARPFAQEMVDQPPRPDDFRSPEQRFDDWLYGIATEMSVVDRLNQVFQLADWDTKPPTSKTHDFILTHKGVDHLVDVKTVQPGAKSLTLGKWETAFAEMHVVYPVFELDRRTAQARLLGATVRYELQPSKLATGAGTSYMMLSRLYVGYGLNDLLYFGS